MRGCAGCAIRKPPPDTADTPLGVLTVAEVAGPPSPPAPDEPVPATVLIVPSGATARTRLLKVSAIRKPPSAVADTAVGLASAAAVAGPPSPENPNVPVPAAVVITPVGDTRRIRLFAWSATRKPPSGVAATPTGKNSPAAVAGPPSPENVPAPVPATVKMLLVAAPAPAGTSARAHAA